MYNQRLGFLPDRLLPERSASRGVFPQSHREQALSRPAQTQPLCHPHVGIVGIGRIFLSALEGRKLRAGPLGSVQPSHLLYLP